eukprot:8539720-Karenia_brevis.AAC.1
MASTDGPPPPPRGPAPPGLSDIQRKVDSVGMMVNQMSEDVKKGFQSASEQVSAMQALVLSLQMQ